MAQEIFQVDAFTDKPFAGNPAAVCVLPEAADEAWMQNVANEMNLSETACLVQQTDGYDLRWFTPAVEVDLCGHATLASAHILWEQGLLPIDAQARFFTRSGELGAVRPHRVVILGHSGAVVGRERVLDVGVHGFPIALQLPVPRNGDRVPTADVKAFPEKALGGRCRVGSPSEPPFSVQQLQVGGCAAVAAQC